MNSPPDSKQMSQSDVQEKSWLKTGVTVIIWIELILGWSAIASAIFLNPRVPVLLYFFYGAYFGILLWLLYSTCRSTYVQDGQLNHVYWIFGISTFATIGIIFFTFFTAPNAGEIAFIFAIVFVVSLVLLPFISAIFYCFLRGNFVMPTYMRGKRSTPSTPQGATTEANTVTHQLNGKHHEEV